MMKSRFLLVLFSMFLLVACAQVPFMPPTKTPVPTATLSASSRLSQITISVSDDLVFQEFVGEYGFGNGFESYHLTINTNRSFHLKIHFDSGSSVEEDGTITISNGIFQPVKFHGKLVFIDTLVPVKWGKRYLIELRRLNNFCQLVKNGDQLERSGRELFYSEVIDSKTPMLRAETPLLADGQSACP